MLTVKPPTNPSPPKMSLFWSTPNYRDYPYPSIDGRRSRWMDKEELRKWQADHDTWDQHREGRWILFDEEDILMLEDEFSIVSAENMNEYVKESHILIMEGVSADIVSEDMEINPNNRDIYESAMLDGCTKQQALLVAIGHDITIESGDFPPPIGWYKIRPEYGLFYCNERELSITRREKIAH